MPRQVRHPGAHSINVAAVQARIRFFSRAEEFRRQMADDIHRAMEASPDLIVLPEDIGTGLVALGTGFASRASSITQATIAVGIRNIWRALPLKLRTSVSAPRALLLTMARRMREVYESTFADLASECGVFIAAGTALLPDENAPGPGVYNTFFLFAPDGSVRHTARKVNLIDLETHAGLDLVAGSPDALPIWPTEIGTFAPLVCYDAWDAPMARRLVSEGAQMLLVPSANPEPWNERVQEDRREGMYSRIRELGVPGVEPFAVGALAGLTFEGRSWILAPDPERTTGVRTLACARTATEPEVISATVELPAPATTEESASDGSEDAL